MMRERSTLKIILLSSLVTCAFAVVTLFVAVVASSNVSGTFGFGGGEGGGIGGVAGGLSERFIASLLVALPVVFLLVVLLLRRRYR